MGIYDRDYIQERSGGFALFAGGGSTVKTLILVNVGVFVVIWLGGPAMHEFATRFLAARSMAIFRQGHLWQLLTYAFLHFDLFHLLWNMLFLWFVGRELETIYGPRDFLWMYLTAAVVAGLCWAAIDQSQQGSSPMLGASGAVAASIMIFTLYYPKREILLFFILPVPMWLAAIFFFGGDLLGLVGNMQGARGEPIAFAAHLGGAGYGFLFKAYDLRWSRLLSGRSLKRRPRLRIFSPEGRPRRSGRQGAASPTRADAGLAPRPSVGTAADEQLDAKVDEILAKIAREGRAGLTEEENRILQEASQRARNRRGERLR